jgi:AmiR/NasT family two-component response regulator
VAAVFARKASVISGDAGAEMTDVEVTLRHQEALRSRSVITLATGVLMERECVDEVAAFTDLLRLSLYHGERRRERAQAMVHSARRAELSPEWGLDG